MNFEQAILVELSGITSKVYPLDAQQGATAPYIVYTNNRTVRLKSHTTHTGLINSDYQFDIFHTTYESLVSLLSSIITELKTWEKTNLGITGPYIQDMYITDEVKTFDYETLLYQGTIDFTITYQES
jgi:hypothetical protein